MTSKSPVYIAGVGSSPLPSEGSSGRKAIASLVSAATKALLDAGVTFDDVSKGVTSVKSGSEVFKAFDERGIPVNEAESGSEFDTAFRLVKDRSLPCVLMIATEKSTAVALIFTSDNFLGKRPYLRDSSALVRKSDKSSPKSDGPTAETLSDACRLVWNLRGWSEPQKEKGKKEKSRYQGKSSTTFDLSRADGKDIPEWKQVQHRQDGKHRLGHNPARETKEISQEDFEAVRAVRKDHKRRSDGNSVQFERKGGDRAALAKL